jgi:hypothetical protein
MNVLRFGLEGRRIAGEQPEIKLVGKKLHAEGPVLIVT